MSSAWSVVGHVWSLTMSELDIICEGKKEMATNHSRIKSIYDNAHNLALQKLSKPTDIDKRLYLSALFEVVNINRNRFLTLARQLPLNTIRSIKAMERAIKYGSMINLQGIQANTVDEIAMQRILLGIYLNHAKPNLRPSIEIDFIVDLLCSLWSPHNDVNVSWYVEHKYIRRCILTISFIYSGTTQLGSTNKKCPIQSLHVQTLSSIIPRSG